MGLGGRKPGSDHRRSFCTGALSVVLWGRGGVTVWLAAAKSENSAHGMAGAGAGQVATCRGNTHAIRCESTNR